MNVISVVHSILVTFQITKDWKWETKSEWQTLTRLTEETQASKAQVLKFFSLPESAVFTPDLVLHFGLFSFRHKRDGFRVHPNSAAIWGSERLVNESDGIMKLESGTIDNSELSSSSWIHRNLKRSIIFRNVNYRLRLVSFERTSTDNQFSREW